EVHAPAGSASGLLQRVIATVHVVTILERCRCSGRKASAAIAQQMAAAQRLWLRKCAPCAIRTTLNPTPAINVPVSAIRASRGRSSSQARKYSATRQKPAAACPPGKQCPTSAAETNQLVTKSAAPPNSRKSQGQ